MASPLIVDLSGHTEILAALERIGPEIAGKASEEVLMEAGEVVLDKINARHNSRRLRATMRPKPRRWQGRVSVEIATPTRAALGIAADDKFYWPAHYNDGHKRVTKNGTVVEVAGLHFMEKGFDAAEPIIADQIDDMLGEKIEELFERGA